MTIPAGWRVTHVENDDGCILFQYPTGVWAANKDGRLFRTKEGRWYFPTASAAMAAIEEAK